MNCCRELYKHRAYLITFYFIAVKWGYDLDITGLFDFFCFCLFEWQGRKLMGYLFWVAVLQMGLQVPFSGSETHYLPLTLRWWASIWLIKMLTVEWKAGAHLWSAEGYTHENFPCPARGSHLLKEWIQPSALFTVMVTLKACQMICAELTPIMLKYTTCPPVTAAVWSVTTVYSSYPGGISADPTHLC